MSFSNYSTNDLQDLKNTILQIKTDIKNELQAFKTEMRNESVQSKSDIKSEIFTIRNEIKQVRTDNKNDIMNLKSEFHQMKAEIQSGIQAFRTEMKTEIKTEMQQLKIEIQNFKTEIRQTRSDVKTEIVNLKPEVQNIRTDINNELRSFKAEVQQIKTSIKSDTQQLRSDLKTDNQNVKFDMKTDSQQIKSDIKTELHNHKAEMQQQRRDINNDIQSLKSDILKVRSDVKTEIQQTKVDIGAKFQQLKSDLRYELNQIQKGLSVFEHKQYLKSTYRTLKRTSADGVSDILVKKARTDSVSENSFTGDSGRLTTASSLLPSTFKIGFLGLQNMAPEIVKNLLITGHSVTVWDELNDKCANLVKAGAKQAQTPQALIYETDIIFSCMSDVKAVREIFFGKKNILKHFNSAKSYVEMTTIDGKTSQEIFNAISKVGSPYLECQIQGGKIQAEDGSLVVLTAGDQSLFDNCQTCFRAVAEDSFYLGEVGTACKMNLILQLMTGVILAGLKEAMALSVKAEVNKEYLLEVLEVTPLACPLIINKNIHTDVSIQNMHKNLSLCLEMGHTLDQQLPMTKLTNTTFENAMIFGQNVSDIIGFHNN